MPGLHLTLNFVCEQDRQLGSPVFHVFPTHQPHDPEIGCSCRPTLSDFYEAEPGLFVELWWHWRRS